MARGSTAKSVQLPEGLSARVMDVAVRLFADRGYAGTSIREVCEGAGCTKPALYYHYPSKDALFTRAVEDKVAALAEAIERADDRALTVRARLTATVRAIVAFATKDPAGLLLLYRASKHPEEGQPAVDLGPVHDAPLAWARAAIEEGIRGGEIRHDVDVDDALFALQGLVDLRCCAFIFGGATIPEDFPERAMSLFFDGVRR